jgi:beta-ribofuranosylaminobenzene 5'-phosphate synthase
LSIKGSEANDFQLQDNRRFNLGAKEYDRLLKSLECFYNQKKFNKRITLIIEGDLVPHFGFGSETTLRLASLEILSLINSHPVDKEELIYFSGRGGVSGIGINTYFDGGFVFDSGVREDSGEFKPSNLLEVRKSLPLLIKRTDVKEWEIGLFVDARIPSLSEEKEADFFKNSCPISDYDAYEILYHSVFGCLSAIMEQDKNAFTDSINRIQKTKWKALERSLYKDLIEKNEISLLAAGASSVGMSSLGPMLYFFSKSPIDEVINNAIGFGMKGKFIKSSMNNSGRIIQYE